MFFYQRISHSLPLDSEGMGEGCGEKKMKCAIYTRVSSEKQVKEGFSLEAQEKEGIRICKQNNWEYEVFVEAGKSACRESLEERPVLMSILDLIEDGKFGCCFVTELDRLSRNPVSMAFIKRVFHDNDVKVVTPGQTFDFKDDEDDFISDLLGLLAKRENKIRVRRSKRAMLESILKGGWQGGITPFGYTKDEDKKLIPDPEESKVYQMICDWSLEGKGCNKIALMLNNMAITTKATKGWHKGKIYKWKAGTIFGIIKKPLYKGDFTFKEHKVKMPALISQEKWQQVQDNLRKNYNSAGRNAKRFYLLRGLLYCKKCGRRLFGKIKPSSGERLYCCLSKRPDPDPRFCGLRSVNLDKINYMIWETIKGIVKNSHKLKEAIESQKNEHFVDSVLSETELESIERAIKEKDGEIDKLLDLYTKSKILSIKELDNKIKTYKDIKDALIKQRQEVTERINAASQAESNLKEIENFMLTVSKRIDSFTDSETQEFLNLVINKIWVDYDVSSKTHLIEIEGAVPIFEDFEIEKPEPKESYRQLQHSHI